MTFSKYYEELEFENHLLKKALQEFISFDLFLCADEGLESKFFYCPNCSATSDVGHRDYCEYYQLTKKAKELLGE